MMRNSLLSLSGLAVLSTLTLTGCGGNVSGNMFISKPTINVQNDAAGLPVVKVTSNFSLGALMFPTLQIPVTHNGHQLGTLQMIQGIGGGVLELSVNVADLVDVQATSATLPNGNALPIAGLEQVLALEAGSKSKVYVGFAGAQRILGYAIAIEQFDNIAQYVAGVNVFFGFDQNKIKGTAGVFTGIGSGNSGLAVFLDASKELVEVTSAPVDNNLGLMGLAVAKAKSLVSPSATFVETASSKKTKKLQDAIYSLSQKRQTLKVK